MARIDLTLRKRPGHMIAGRLVRPVRLVALVRLGGPKAHAVCDAVVDTGANLTVIPNATWSRVESHIRWLTRAADRALPDLYRRVEGIGGGNIPVRIGTIDLQFLNPRVVPPWPGRVSRIVAMFAQDNGELKETILGLGGGAFDGRRLAMDYDRDEAWIDE